MQKSHQKETDNGSEQPNFFQRSRNSIVGNSKSLKYDKNGTTVNSINSMDQRSISSQDAIIQQLRKEHKQIVAEGRQRLIGNLVKYSNNQSHQEYEADQHALDASYLQQKILDNNTTQTKGRISVGAQGKYKSTRGYINIRAGDVVSQN